MSERYSRQLSIEGWDQDKLAGSHVVILGVGALGCAVSLSLASMGVGRLTLVDYDSIEMSNLNRQIFYRERHVGMKKALIAKKFLQDIQPDLKVDAYVKKMQDLDPSIYSGAELIIACLDTYEGRRWANSLSLSLKIPLVLGGIYEFLGDVQVIKPYDTPCFECQPLIPARQLSQACTPSAEKKHQLHLEPTLPSVITTSQIIGGYMSQEAVKVLLNMNSIVRNFLFIDVHSHALTELALERNEKCIMCSNRFTSDPIPFVITQNEPVTDIHSRIAWAFGLDDPVIHVEGTILRGDPNQEIPTSLGNLSGKKAFVSDSRIASSLILSLTSERQRSEGD